MYNNFRADEEKITIWADFFKHEDRDAVMNEFKLYTKDPGRRSFPPNAPDLLPVPPRPLSISEHEAIEGEKRMLELQEYHANEDVGPMPDWLREKMRKRFGSDFEGFGGDSE